MGFEGALPEESGGTERDDVTLQARRCEFRRRPWDQIPKDFNGTLQSPARKLVVCPKFVLIEGTLLLCPSKGDEREAAKYAE